MREKTTNRGSSTALRISSPTNKRLPLLKFPLETNFFISQKASSLPVISIMKLFLLVLFALLAASLISATWETSNNLVSGTVQISGNATTTATGLILPNNNSGIVNTWNNPTGMYSSTDSNSSANTSTSNNTHAWYGFVMNIPLDNSASNTSINGILVQTLCKVNTSVAGKRNITINVSNGASWSGVSNSSGNLTAAYVNRTHGNLINSLWGLAWTASSANAINVSVKAYMNATGATVLCDAMWVNINYTIANYEVNKTTNQYNYSTGNIYNITSINVTVNVSGYTNVSSKAKGNNMPNLFVRINNGTAWVDVGLLNITGKGNFSIVITEPGVLKAWSNTSNRNITIQGVYFDANFTAQDQINYTGVWISITSLNAPAVTNVNVTPRFAINGTTINISANVTSNNSISSVIAMIYYPNGASAANYTMSNSGGGSIYWNASYVVNFYPSGTYNVTIFANDSVGNVNNSVNANFSPILNLSQQANISVDGSFDDWSNITNVTDPVDVSTIRSFKELLGLNDSDNAGYSIAVADVNGDGKNDIILGANYAVGPNEACGDGVTSAGWQCGSAQIYFGPNTTKTTWSSKPDLELVGLNDSDEAGASLAVADVNGDGKNDIILGAEGAEGSGDTCANGASGANCGSAQIYFGPNTTKTTWSSKPDLELLGLNDSDQAGYSIAVADVNGDGKNDIIIGAITAIGPNEACGDGVTSAGWQCGSAQIYFGPNTTKTTWSSKPDLELVGLNDSDEAGASLAVADVNGDGKNDIILGANGATSYALCADGVGSSGCGSAQIYFGPNTTKTTWSSKPDVRLAGLNANDEAGTSLAVADVNGDGKNDIILGANYAAGSGFTCANGASGANCGSAQIYFGPNTTKTTWSSKPDLELLGLNDSDRAGTSLAVADVNGDGKNDIILGANHAVGPNGKCANGASGVSCGSAQIYFGPNTTKTTWSSSPDLELLGLKDNDRAGTSLAVSNLSSDGFPDVILGAYTANSSSGCANGQPGAYCGSAQIYLFTPGNNFDIVTMSPANNASYLFAKMIVNDSIDFSNASRYYAVYLSTNDATTGSQYAVSGATLPFLYDYRIQINNSVCTIYNYTNQSQGTCDFSNNTNTIELRANLNLINMTANGSLVNVTFETGTTGASYDFAPDYNSFLQYNATGGGGGGGGTSLTACGNLTTANTVYTLMNDVNSSGTCFNITANNVTLDGAGHIINYSTSGTADYGVYSSMNNSVIKNARITEGNSSGSTTNAIYLTGAQNATIQNNTIIMLKNDYSVYISTSDNANISYNNITAALQGSGVYISSSNRPRIISNKISAGSWAAGAALYISSCSNGTINNNTMTSSDQTPGIYLTQSAGFNLTSNNVTSTYRAYVIDATASSYCIHSIDTTNLAEGKPVNFSLNATNAVYDGINFSAYGEVIFACGNNISIKNSNITGGGLSLFSVQNLSFNGNTINTSSGEGILMRNNNQVNFSNSSINGAFFGIEMNNDMNINIINSNITAYTRGIEIWSGQKITITGSRITGGANYGISGQISDIVIDSSTIVATSNSIGINYQYSGTGPSILNNVSIIADNYPIRISAGSNIVATNVILNATGGTYDFFINSDGSTLNFTNVTHADGSGMNVSWNAGVSGTLNYGWWLDANITSSGAALSGATVNATSTLGSSQTNTTDANGLTRMALLQYTRNNTGGANITYYSNYTINASKTSYSSNNTKINMTTNRQVNLVLNSLSTGVNCTSYKCLIIRAAGSPVAIFDALGAVDLKVSLTQSALTSPGANDFIIRNSTGIPVAWINASGNLLIKGTLSENNGVACTPPTNSFFIRGNNSECVAYVNNTGDLWLKGDLRENVLT